MAKKKQIQEKQQAAQQQELQIERIYHPDREACLKAVRYALECAREALASERSSETA